MAALLYTRKKARWCGLVCYFKTVSVGRLLRWGAGHSQPSLADGGGGTGCESFESTAPASAI